MSTSGPSEPSAPAAKSSKGDEKKSRKKELDPAERRRQRRILLRECAIASPFCVALAFAFPTADLWPIAYVALAGLAWRLRTIDTPKRAMFLGFVFATSGNLVGYYWIPELLMRFGKIPLVGAIPIFVVFAFYQGLVYGFWAALVVWARRHTGLPVWLTGPPTLVALEFSVPMLFPWALGETQYLNLYLAQSADLFGVFGISYMVLQVNLSLEEAAWRRWLAPEDQRRPWPVKLLVATAAVYVALCAYGAYRVADVDARAAAAPRLRVGLIQPNIGIFSKHKAVTGETRMEHLTRLSSEAEAAGAELIVWPEASLPSVLLATRDWIPPRASPFRGFATPVIIGTIRVGEIDPDTRRRRRMNSMILAYPDGSIRYEYDKNFLVWFSEKIPYSDWFPWINKVLPYSANFEAGDGVPRWQFGEYVIAPNICFEDTLPRWTSLLETPPHLIVNSTEDAWFGATTEPYFHLAFATFRSIETHAPMVRAVNTGPSTVIDPVGRIVASAGIFEERVMVHDVPMLQTETLYRRFGDWFAYLCVLATLSMAGYTLYRKRRLRRFA